MIINKVTQFLLQQCLCHPPMRNTTTTTDYIIDQGVTYLPRLSDTCLNKQPIFQRKLSLIESGSVLGHHRLQSTTIQYYN